MLSIMLVGFRFGDRINLDSLKILDAWSEEKVKCQSPSRRLESVVVATGFESTRAAILSSITSDAHGVAKSFNSSFLYSFIACWTKFLFNLLTLKTTPLPTVFNSGLVSAIVSF